MIDPAPPGTIAAEYLPDLTSLTMDHRATFRIGQVVRLSVVMERTARDVHARLQNATTDNRKDGPQRFPSLVSEIREQLRDGRFPYAKTADRALEQVERTYRERNRFAHDHLIQVDLELWSRMSLENIAPPKHQKDLDEASLRDAVLDVVVAQWRLHALDILVGRWIANEPETREAAEDDGWFAILDGQFVLTTGGGARITGEI